MRRKSDMYGQTRFHRRGSIYHFRAMAPKDLRFSLWEARDGEILAHER